MPCLFIHCLQANIPQCTSNICPIMLIFMYNQSISVLLTIPSCFIHAYVVSIQNYLNYYYNIILNNKFIFMSLVIPWVFHACYMMPIWLKKISPKNYPPPHTLTIRLTFLTSHNALIQKRLIPAKYAKMYFQHMSQNAYIYVQSVYICIVGDSWLFPPCTLYKSIVI